MQINKEQVISELLSLTDQAIIAVKKFKTLDITQLNFKKAPEQWSILECIEHLNLYGNFYLPEIQKQLLETTHEGVSPFFRPGIIGNYFAGLMKTANGKIKKIQSPKDKKPANSILTVITPDGFLKQQELFKSIL